MGVPAPGFPGSPHLNGGGPFVPIIADVDPGPAAAPGQWWITTAGAAKVRNAAGTGWIAVSAGGGTPNLAAVLAVGNAASAKITTLTTPTAAGDAATKGYVDGAIPATPTLAAVLAAGASAGAKITNVTDPVAAQDAATKAYVDGHVGAGLSAVLEQHTAAGSASLDFTTAISSLFDVYLFQVEDIIPAAGTPVLNMLVSTDGGSTWDTTAGHYANSQFVWSSGGTASGGGASQASLTPYPLQGRGMTTALACSGEILVYNPLGTALQNVFMGRFGGGDSVTTDPTQRLDWQGSYNQLAAVNAVRFIMSSGNIASGKIRAYGYSN